MSQEFIRYKAEAIPQGEFIQDFCFRNKVPNNLFNMVQGYTASYYTGACRRTATSGSILPSFGKTGGNGTATDENYDSHPHKQRHTYPTTQPKLPKPEKTGKETGGVMLNITGINRFYYLCGFDDMRCKYDCVLSVIHSQLNREPEEDEVFIVMSKDWRKGRLFAYDCRSFSLYEKRFATGYRFMQVCRMNGISTLDYLKRFFREIVKGRRDYENLLPMTIGINTNKF